MYVNVLQCIPLEIFILFWVWGKSTHSVPLTTSLVWGPEFPQKLKFEIEIQTDDGPTKQES